MPQLIDLSQEIYQGMPIYAGHLKTVIWTHASHEETAKNFEGGFSFIANGILLCDHGPTHVDAIRHFDPRPDAPSIERMPLATFYGPATCMDVSGREPCTYITAEHMDAGARACAAGVRRGDILLLYTGSFDQYGSTPDYARLYPGLDESASEWLVEHGIKAFGVDSPSPDNPASKTYPCHMMCRRTGITHYENLANLRAVLGKRFTFMGFPLRFRDGTGSPVRVVALLADT